MLVGVLLYQGAGHLHLRALRQIGISTKAIHTEEDFTADLTCLILPGGESGVQSNYIKAHNLKNKILECCEKITVLGTCAGLILLSSYKSTYVEGLSIFKVNLERNFYGSQVVSGFYKSDNMRDICFIRAPGITEILDEKIEILDTFAGKPILIKKRKVYAARFHPELLVDKFYLELFSNLV